MRGFELIEGMNGELPIKATIHSAGVDFIACSDITIPSFRFKGKATLVPTGVKAFMQKMNTYRYSLEVVFLLTWD